MEYAILGLCLASAKQECLVDMFQRVVSHCMLFRKWSSLLSRPPKLLRAKSRNVQYSEHPSEDQVPLWNLSFSHGMAVWAICETANSLGRVPIVDLYFLSNKVTYFESQPSSINNITIFHKDDASYIPIYQKLFIL